MATEAVILQEEMKEPEVRSHQSHHRAKGPAIACGRSISHRGHPSRLPYGSLRSALTGPDRDAGKSLHYQAMAGALCKGSTLSTYQRSLILLLTQAGFLMEGLNSTYRVNYGLGRSWRIIQDAPNLSLSWPKRKAKKVSVMGMNTSPPAESSA